MEVNDLVSNLKTFRLSVAEGCFFRVFLTEILSFFLSTGSKCSSSTCRSSTTSRTTTSSVSSRGACPYQLLLTLSSPWGSKLQLVAPRRRQCARHGAQCAVHRCTGVRDGHRRCRGTGKRRRYEGMYCSRFDSSLESCVHGGCGDVTVVPDEGLKVPVGHCGVKVLSAAVDGDGGRADGARAVDRRRPQRRHLSQVTRH